jgi:cyclophilin family peptidyl-prolyl cis-trans isomerase/HEAT repeat protein
MTRRFLNLLLIICITAIIGCGGEEEEAVLLPDKKVQIAIWEDMRRADTLLYTYLADEDPEIRSRACYALGMIEPEGASAYIVDLVDDPQKNVRIEAIFALSLIGDSMYSGKVVPLLFDPESEVVHQAAIALGRMGGDTAVSALMMFARDKIPRHRAWAAEGLWRADADTAIELLVNLAADSSEFVEQAAVYALRRLEARPAAEIFRSKLKDTIPEIRMYAAEGLRAIKDSAFLMALTNQLSRDQEWTVKASILRAIMEVGDKKIIKALMNLLSQREHPLITGMGLSLIGEFQMDALVPKVEPFLEDEEKFLKGEALIALAKLNRSKFMEIVSREIDTYDWYLRMKAAEALQFIQTPEGADFLEKLLADPDHRVRTAVLYSLAEYDFLEMEDYLGTALDDPDPAVVSTTIELIAKLKLSQLSEKIHDIYEDEVDEADAIFRFSILYNLSEWVVDSQIADENILELLNKALEDRDRNVRKKAIDIFAMTGVDKSEYLGYFDPMVTAATYDAFYGRFDRNPIAEINTDRGQIRVRLLYDNAPRTVSNFIKLAESGFYDGVIFHRVVPNFVIQAGDPHGDGFGGPGYTIRSEFNRHEYTRGTMGMAHAGKDTGGSQWFICHSPQPHLNGRYTAFGQVIYGMRIVDRILVGDKINSIEIINPDGK